MPIFLQAAPAALPFATPAITDALTRLRQDIFDQAGPSPRWADSDLTRAIDRALDQYSFLQPFVQAAIVQSIPNSRIYPTPSNPLGTAWWVDSVEYPMNMWPRNYQPFRELPQPSLGPAPAPTVAVGPAGVLNATYRYYVTFVGLAGETLVSPSATPLALANQQATLTLPTGQGPYCQARNIYRTPANGADGSELFLAQVADNTTTAYTDNALDGTLGAAPPVVDTTLNVPLFEIEISDSRLPGPAIAGGVPSQLLVQFGCKHVWAQNGTTLPEQYHDVVLLGAAAYACLAFQVPTSDLFEYQDGELRDRVSEVKTPEHWLATGNNLLGLFKGRLEEVKKQVNAGYAGVAQWGAVPSRWQWT